MIIGFLGKGGSGKSTLSAALAIALSQNGTKTLAIDADHNLDLTFNLGISQLFPYLGSSMKDLFSHSKLQKTDHYTKALELSPNIEFTISPLDPFTQKYSIKVNDFLSVMAGGSQTDAVIYGQSCSHILTNALKVYLPLLNLDSDHAVVVDEKAGLDGVTTGVTTGFNYAFVCVEPTTHGIKVAGQIANSLDFYGTPYDFVINKAIDDKDVKNANKNLKKPPVAIFYHSPQMARIDQKTNTLPQLTTLIELVKNHVSSQGDDRLSRSLAKIQRNKDYKNSHMHT